MSMLTLTNLSLQRGKNTLLSSLSFSASQGDIVVILGPNGAGKSTLLLALAGLFPAYKGDILFHGKASNALSHQQLAQTVAWQGELPPTEFGLTVQQRLQLASNNDIGNKPSSHALKPLDLQAFAHRVLGELSSGERQRVEIAAMLMRDCPIWLLDEPTTHLDLKHQLSCLQIMRKQAAQGKLILTVLHDLQQAAAVADSIILLDGLGGVQVGSAEEMLTTAKLEPVFQVKLQGQGRSLMPAYDV